jgi:hypothetical protein
MNDTRLRAAYGLSVRPHRGEDCPSPEALLELAEGRAPDPLRAELLDHLGDCRPCQHDLEMLRTLAVSQQRLTARPWRTVVAASVAVLLAGGTVWWTVLRGPSGDPGVVRSDPHRVATVQPGHEVRLPVTFVWRAETGARVYQVIVVDSSGSTVWSTRTPDTTASAPEAVGLVAGREYGWWVEAYLEDGTSRRSLARRFRITTP